MNFELRGEKQRHFFSILSRVLFPFHLTREKIKFRTQTCPRASLEGRETDEEIALFHTENNDNSAIRH
jgi:hypothetical protein